MTHVLTFEEQVDQQIEKIAHHLFGEYSDQPVSDFLDSLQDPEQHYLIRQLVIASVEIDLPREDMIGKVVEVEYHSSRGEIFIDYNIQSDFASEATPEEFVQHAKVCEGDMETVYTYWFVGARQGQPCVELLIDC